MEEETSGKLDLTYCCGRSQSIPRPNHLVTLTAHERKPLTSLIRTGTTSAHVHMHARILLNAESGPGGLAGDDATIVNAVEVSRPTVKRVRKAFATRGLDAALHRKTWSGPSRRKLDGAQEAHLAALACSPPPEGQQRWSLSRLADKLVELKVVDTIARNTVRVTLKKTNARRG